MKVIKLNEADSNTLMTVKNAFERDPLPDSKLQKLKGFLINQCGLSGDAWRSLEKFGIDFLSKWMNSFKWEEAGRTGNEFIAALNYPASPIFTQNKDRFIKAYNAYAANCINSKDELEYNPIFNDSLYRYSANDIKSIINYWSKAYNKLGEDKLSELLNLFYEKTTDNIGDWSTSWRVRTLSELEEQLRRLNGSEDEEVIERESDDKEQLNNLLRKNNSNRQFALELLKTISNENNNT